MKNEKKFIFSILILSSLFFLMSCSSAANKAITKPSQSSSVIKKSMYPEVKNQTINNALRAYPTLADFDKLFSNPKLNPFPEKDRDSQILIKLVNDGQKGGWVGVKPGTPPTTVVSTDSDGKPVKANDPRGATIGQIRAALKARDEGKLK